MRTLRRRWQDEEEGFALATVLAITMLGAIVATVMLTATMRTVGATTATRASVQARAAAQSGIDTVRALIDGGGCSTGTVTGDGWRVTIHPSTGANASAADPIGCPSSAARSVFLQSDGTASSTGVGNESGDERAVESLLIKPGDSPTFNKAAFGKNGIDLSTNLELRDSSGTTSADIFTEGSFSCASNMVIQGSVYAKTGVNFSSAPCRVEGDVLTEGNFTCAAGTTIEGNLFVRGNANFTSSGCDIRGIVQVNGNVYMSTGGTKLGTTLMVGGQLSTSGNPATSVSTITVGGRVNGGTGYWYEQLKSAWGARLAENTPVALTPAYPTDEANEFPQLTANDPLITTGFTSRSWSSTVLGGITSGSNPPACSMNWGGNHYSAPMKITTNTRLDARTDCPGGIVLGMGMWFELSADLVIVSDYIKQNGDIRITSGDGKKHSIYFVSPWTPGSATCTTTGTPGIKFESGNWNQDSKTSVMLYSARPLEISTTPTMYGQAYGCTLKMSTSTKLYYNPVGSAVDPSTVPWTLSYIRDAG